MLSDKDLGYLERCIDLAEIGLNKGNSPFGSILVSEHDEILFEGHNETSLGDATRHPELAITQWAAKNLSAQQRKNATVYTSGEHCPMCAAAHGWVGLGRIVIASSSKQLEKWYQEFGQSTPVVKRLSIHEVISDTKVDGPAYQFAERIKELHKRYMVE